MLYMKIKALYPKIITPNLWLVQKVFCFSEHFYVIITYTVETDYNNTTGCNIDVIQINILLLSTSNWFLLWKYNWIKIELMNFNLVMHFNYICSWFYEYVDVLWLHDA